MLERKKYMLNENKKQLKMISLFDGSGGFPLAGVLCGVEPVAASEVEPFPIRVTSKRFPNMKHIGDVSQVKGKDLEPVDIITFGSPCQDMSVAGKRAGLKHDNLGDEETTRSGLFIEAIRIIKEMREATNGEYPAFAIWENVPGAYSSNKGEDFRAVLEEFCKIKEPTVSISRPSATKDKWLNAGEIVGSDYSIAWRTLDAQYWGVPQRRRRIYLVADFRGQCASEILFKSEGVRGNFKKSRETREGTSNDTENCVGTTNQFCYGVTTKGNGDAFISKKKHASLTNGGGQAEQGYPCCLQPNASGTLLYNLIPLENYPEDSRIKLCEDGKCQTLTNRMGTGDNNVPLVMFDSKNAEYLTFEPGITSREGGHCYENICGTLRANAGDNQLSVCYAIDQQGGKGMCGFSENISPTMMSDSHGTPHAVCYALDRAFFNQGQNAQYPPQCYEDGTCPTLVARGTGAVCYSIQRSDEFKENKVTSCQSARQYKDNTDLIVENKNTYGFYPQMKAECITFTKEICPTLIIGGNKSFSIVGDHDNRPTDLTNLVVNEPQYIVRRLTPLECCRLQGFPDCWTSELETPEPTEEDLIFWREVFETHRKVITKTSKSKTDKQIIKWLKNPYSDSAIYKMWGNGIALPNALFVMQGVVDKLNKK